MAYKSIKISSRRLAEIIEHSDRTVAWVAEKLEVSTGAVFSWLKQPEVAGVNPDVFHKMVELFKVKPEDLKVDGDGGSVAAQRVLRELVDLVGKGLLSPADVIDTAREAASASPAARKKMDRKGKPQ